MSFKIRKLREIEQNLGRAKIQQTKVPCGINHFALNTSLDNSILKIQHHRDRLLINRWPIWLEKENCSAIPAISESLILEIQLSLHGALKGSRARLMTKGEACIFA